MQFILFFKSSSCNSSFSLNRSSAKQLHSSAKKGINSVPQTAATHLCLFSIVTRAIFSQGRFLWELLLLGTVLSRGRLASSGQFVRSMLREGKEKLSIRECLWGNMSFKLLKYIHIFLAKDSLNETSRHRSRNRQKRRQRSSLLFGGRAAIAN